jgi:hypothetical protein
MKIIRGLKIIKNKKEERRQVKIKMAEARIRNKMMMKVMMMKNILQQQKYLMI